MIGVELEIHKDSRRRALWIKGREPDDYHGRA